MPLFIRSRPLAYQLHFRSEPSILPYDGPSDSFTATTGCIRISNSHTFPKALPGEYKISQTHGTCGENFIVEAAEHLSVVQCDNIP